MNSLLLLALLWLPIALVIDVTVRAISTPFTSFPKKALFYLVTLPLVWLRLLEGGVHYVAKYSFVEKVARWFKS
jgi:hypothetical protein